MKYWISFPSCPPTKYDDDGSSSSSANNNNNTNNINSTGCETMSWKLQREVKDLEVFLKCNFKIL